MYEVFIMIGQNLEKHKHLSLLLVLEIFELFQHLLHLASHLVS